MRLKSKLKLIKTQQIVFYILFNLFDCVINIIWYVNIYFFRCNLKILKGQIYFFMFAKYLHTERKKSV